VGNDPDSVPSVRGADGASWNNDRLNLVTDSLEVPTDPVKDNCVLVFSTRTVIGVALHASITLSDFHAPDSSNVLTNDPSGPGFLYDSEHFRPEVAVIVLAKSFPGAGKRLAWKSPGKESCAPEPGSVEGPDVGDKDGLNIVPFNISR
jgi:hypothetical protein